ncbi:hypothetical protein LUX33_38740 [Actinomadura madurae]|uniref:hypothetical protein n=1 Tax=Actinomadura madurae TaxID=1993 RepID=UPI0020D240F9|nr:hypothetical protein [Actinomadura madurae]MCP9953787.1 hypothetical protein [Actinomadura madurae]
MTERATQIARTRVATTATSPSTPARTTRVMMPSEIGAARRSAPADTASSRPRSRVRLESAVVFHSTPAVGPEVRTRFADATKWSSSVRNRLYSGIPTTRW